jgi:hypothetical protein
VLKKKTSTLTKDEEQKKGESFLKSVGDVIPGSALHANDIKLIDVPPVPELFVGREKALEETKKILGIISDQRSRLPTKIAAIHGLPGVGKTTFASALACEPGTRHFFTDGVLWATFDQNPDLMTILIRWGVSLGNPDMRLAMTIEECVECLSNILRGMRVLLIVDDLWDASHLALLQRNFHEGTALLVTTRLPVVVDNLGVLPNNVYQLDVLKMEDGINLLKALAPRVVSQHKKACRELVRELGGLPLALHVAGRLLRIEAEMWDVHDLLKELRDGVRLLKESPPANMIILANQTIPTVAVLLDKSTGLLNPEIRDRFACLGVLAPKPATFSLDAMKSVWQVDDPRDTVRQLVQRGLLEPLGSGRFQMHALLVAHAKSLLG